MQGGLYAMLWHAFLDLFCIWSLSTWPVARKVYQAGTTKFLFLPEKLTVLEHE